MKAYWDPFPRFSSGLGQPLQQSHQSLYLSHSLQHY